MARSEEMTDNPTITLGEVRRQLGHLPDDTPLVFYVSADTVGDWYHNIDGWSFDPESDVAVTFGDGGPMDTRQW